MTVAELLLKRSLVLIVVAIVVLILIGAIGRRKK
jgi:hypothetical protein